MPSLCLRSSAASPFVASLACTVALAATAGWAQNDAKEPATFDPDAVEAQKVPTDLFVAPEGLEVTLWAQSPLFFNPTNLDIDHAGRVWVAEGVRYRRHHAKWPKGDRIMVLEDRDKDGKAEHSHVFVQEEALVAPLGVAVFDNQVVVSQPPDLIVYTDVDRDLVFDPKVDKREVLLTGFAGKNHDHSLHSVTAGPDGRWYFNSSNCGALFTDRSGKTFRIAGPYRPKPIGPFPHPFKYEDVAGKPSDDGHTYIGGFAVRMHPDGTGVEVIGHNFRNSYEQSVNSFGDVFQNDNDDPPACRVSWMMEYANFGFASNDGQRSWKADRRPGQDTATAEWRQEDPGSAPAGDVYGGGSPTGNVFYENGALGDEWIGTFLACEPGRNVVFSYQPELSGAGFRLERSDFVTSNPASEHDNGKSRFAGSDFLGGGNSVTHELKTLFRPSDIAIGPDGALYITDWYDGRVGGHQALDETCSGAIYRIAPKGFVSKVPEIDPDTIEGQIEALRSPAPNVRHLGFTQLAEAGDAAVAPLAKLMEDPNPFLAARAIWLLAKLGEAGRPHVDRWLTSEDAQQRITAYRALLRVNGTDLELTAQLAQDASPAVRREVALSLRDVPAEEAVDLLVTLAKSYEGGDRSYLEALGTGATHKEAELYLAAREALGQEDAEAWTPAFAEIAWRLHPVEAIPDLAARAESRKLDAEAQAQATDALAFIEDAKAADAMLEIAAGRGHAKSNATWWLINRASNRWQSFDLMPKLAERRIYDPAKVVVQEAITADPKDAPANLPPVAEILKLDGDPDKGKVTVQRCIMCHRVGGVGVEYGPGLDGWGRTQTREVIANSIVHPSSDIAHGFEGHELKMKDGKTVHGLLLKDGNPLIISSMGGLTQVIPANKVAKKRKLDRSLMLSGDQLGLTAQDVADLIAYLKEN